MLFDIPLLKSIFRFFSEDAQATLIVILTATLIVRYTQILYNLLSYIRTLPPGPWGIPVMGYLAFIGNEKHTKYMELAEKYGVIFSARLGNQITIVLSDYRIIRQAFRMEEFTGRPDTPFMQALNGFGVINSEGKLWKEQRRFLHDKLRKRGMTFMGNGRGGMEKMVMTEVHEFLGTLKATNGAPTDLSPILALCTSNVICNIMMSERFTIDDPKFCKFTRLIEEGMRLYGQINTLDYIPAYKYLPGTTTARNKISQNRAEMFEFYKKVIDEHRATLDPANIRDLVDSYLVEILNAKEAGREAELFDGKDHDQQIMQIIGDLFSAGMETIKTTLLWINVYMVRHPDIMRKVQEELDCVVGRNRLPNHADLKYLPFTEATIMEVMRRSSIVPLATTHSPTKDVLINGYRIPAGSQVIPLISSLHMDPTLWVEPKQFNPDRFLTSEGKVHRPEFFMPFGAGRRMCLGDVLAKMELFLFFACMMQQFTITLPEGAEEPSLKGNVGVTISPSTFKVCLEHRPLNNNDTLRNVGSH